MGSNDSTFTHAGPPRVPSGAFEIALHGSCSHCHHWHDRIRLRLSHRFQPFTLVRCDHCRRKWFGLGGDSTHISLLSQQTRTDSNLSQSSSAKVCTDQMPSIDNLVSEASSGGDYGDATAPDVAEEISNRIAGRTASFRSSHVQSTPLNMSAGSSPAGDPQVTSPTDNELPSPMTSHPVTAQVKMRTTTPERFSQKKGMLHVKQLLKDTYARARARISSNHGTRPPIWRCSHTDNGSGGTHDGRHILSANQQSSVNDLDDRAQQSVTNNTVQQPTRATAAGVMSPTKRLSNMSTVDPDAQSLTVPEAANNPETDAERILHILDIRRQKTEEAAKRRTCRCSPSCHCKQGSSGHTRSTIRSSLVPDNPLADRASLYRSHPIEFDHAGAGFSDSPRSITFTTSTGTSSRSGSGHGTVLRTESRQSHTTDDSQATTLHGSDSAPSRRPSLPPSYPPSAAMPSPVSRPSSSMASLPRLVTGLGRATQSAHGMSSTDGERTPTQQDRSDRSIDGERTPTRNHHGTSGFD